MKVAATRCCRDLVSKTRRAQQDYGRRRIEWHPSWTKVGNAMLIRGVHEQRVTRARRKMVRLTRSSGEAQRGQGATRWHRREVPQIEKAVVSFKQSVCLSVCLSNSLPERHAPLPPSPSTSRKRKQPSTRDLQNLGATGQSATTLG